MNKVRNEVLGMFIELLEAERIRYQGYLNNTDKSIQVSQGDANFNQRAEISDHDILVNAKLYKSTIENLELIIAEVKIDIIRIQERVQTPHSIFYSILEIENEAGKKTYFMILKGGKHYLIEDTSLGLITLIGIDTRIGEDLFGREEGDTLSLKGEKVEISQIF